MLFFTFFLLGLTWLMVYRTEKYQKLKAEVEKQSKKRKFCSYVVCVCIYIFCLFNLKKALERKLTNTEQSVTTFVQMLYTYAFLY